MIIFGLSAKIIDVETAVLCDDLKEEIFMDCSPWVNDRGPKDALLLSTCIYGLVQAAQQYQKKIIAILKNIGFRGGDVNPCLMRWDDKAVLYFIPCVSMAILL